MPLEQEIDDDIDIKILGVPPLGPGTPFLDNDTCTKGGGYLFLSGFSSLYDAIHVWMTRQMDGWKKLHEKRWFVILNTDNYFALVAFQMARLTLETIAMRHCQKKVVHVLLLVVRFVILDADNYFVLVAFQMTRPTLSVALSGET
jgi:hypothetical protein